VCLLGLKDLMGEKEYLLNLRAALSESFFLQTRRPHTFTDLSIANLKKVKKSRKDLSRAISGSNSELCYRIINGVTAEDEMQG